MKTCRISFCTMGTSHESGLCAVHATCFLLTPGARKTGAAYENALTEYVTRTEVRHHLKRHEEARP